MSRFLRIISPAAFVACVFLTRTLVPASEEPVEHGATNVVAETPVVAPSAEVVTNVPPAPSVPVPDPVLARLEPAVEALASRLQAIETSLARQHRQSVQAGEESTRTILLAAGCFAVAALLGSLLAALILSRAMRRVSEVVVAALPSPRLLTAGSMSAGGLMPSASMEVQAAPSGTSVELVTTRFLGVIEQLEKRIVELEHSAQTPEGGARGNGNGKTGGAPYEFSVSALHQKQYPDLTAAEVSAADPVVSWLGKGQALLSLGQVAEALGCFDRAVELAPGNPEAQVKRGLALEKLERWDEALACYDKAIAADSKFTLAYLYKGGVCNRMQRYREAVECYESALKSEQKPAVQ